MERFDPGTVGWRINSVGYLLMGEGHLDLAEEVFLLNTRLGPGISNTWDSLAECQMEMGKYDEAIAHYEKALELDPDNPNAQARIDKMRAESR